MLSYCLHVHFPDCEDEHLFMCLFADWLSVISLEEAEKALRAVTVEPDLTG